MFPLGIGLAIAGYALAYYGINVLTWSRSNVSAKTRPVPMRYLFGVALPDTPPKEPFHPPFTLNDTDRANAVIALGGPEVIAGTAHANPNLQINPDGSIGEPGQPGVFPSSTA